MRCILIILILKLTLVNSQISSGMQSCYRSRIKISERFYTLPQLSAESNAPSGRIYFRRDNVPIVNTMRRRTHADTPFSTSELETKDALGNKMYLNETGDVFIYLIKTRNIYRVYPDIKHAKFVLTFDRRAILMIDPINGTVYLFNSYKPRLRGNIVNLKSIPQLGADVVSMAIHPLTGMMVLARYRGMRSYIFTLKKLSIDPCASRPANEEQTFKNNWRATMDDILLTHMDDKVYEYNCDATNSQCKDINTLKTYVDRKFSQILFMHRKIVRNLKETNKRLELELSKMVSNSEHCDEMNNSFKEISRLIQTVTEKSQTIKDVEDSLGPLVAGTDLVLPFFKSGALESTITANKIDQYSRRNYECILKKDMKEFKENMTAAETQVEYLFYGLDMVKNSLNAKTQINESTPIHQELLDSVFGTNDGDSNDYDELDSSLSGVKEDNPFEILETVDVRFGRDNE